MTAPHPFFATAARTSLAARALPSVTHTTAVRLAWSSATMLGDEEPA